jgi:hypothetical protein
MEDLIREHHEGTKDETLTPNYYLEEIKRGELREYSEKMIAMTESTRDITADIRKWTRG